jgi:hypothetical protein
MGRTRLPLFIPPRKSNQSLLRRAFLWIGLAVLWILAIIATWLLIESKE